MKGTPSFLLKGINALKKRETCIILKSRRKCANGL
jgi:hypothetical protein